MAASDDEGASGSVTGEDEFPMPVLERLLVACLDDQNVMGVAAVIGSMAMRDPRRAEELRQALLWGCDLAQAGEPS